MVRFSFKFQREREGLREWLPLLRRTVLLERAADRVVERRPDGRQVPIFKPIQLLRMESSYTC